MRLTGRVWKFGPNVDTDAMMPGRFCHLTDAAELARHVFEDARPDFARGVKRGDVIVASANFGCGSSREVAPVGIKAAGVACLVAPGFGRIFYRNCINIGLPILQACGVWEDAADGHVLDIDLDTGMIANRSTGRTFRAVPFPPFVKEIIAAGGLMARIKKNLVDGVYRPNG